jgi:Flp pilus assembly protein TadB
MPTPKQSDSPSDGAWHLDKKVNISHIIATLMLAAAIFTWGSNIEQRIALVEASATRQAQVDQAQDQEFRRYVVEMRDDIRELSRKIDKLIETRGQR